MKRIFVYGSLRKHMYNYERYLKGKSRFIQNGFIKGTLYALKDVAYPAVSEGNQKVFGEIYEVDDIVAANIDELEGCASCPGEYEKHTKTIFVTEEDTVDADVYMFNLKYENNKERLKEMIPHGDYVRYIQEHES